MGTEFEGTAHCCASCSFLRLILPCSWWLPSCWSTVEMSSRQRSKYPLQILLETLQSGHLTSGIFLVGSWSAKPITSPHPCLPFPLILLSLIGSRNRELMMPVSRAAAEACQKCSDRKTERFSAAPGLLPVVG